MMVSVRLFIKRLGLWIRGKGFHTASGEFWGREVLAKSDDFVYWLAIPPVVHWVNRKLTGAEHIWPLSWFMLSLEGSLPVNRALSLGCGKGDLEREVLRHGGAQQIDGVDVSKALVEEARKLAADAGYAGAAHYHLGDALSWLKQAVKGPGYDLIFFHCSLHHLKELEQILSLSRDCLVGGSPGLLYVDEYIGPSRKEWRNIHLGYANGLFTRIPRKYRRASQVYPPVAFDDPTEMIRSSEIEAVLRSTFNVQQYKPYYGNVVMPLVSAIKAEGFESTDVLAVIQEAMDLEDYLIERGLIEPFYAVFVCKPQ